MLTLKKGYLPESKLMDDSGFARVSDLVKGRNFRCITFMDIMAVVFKNRKAEFKLGPSTRYIKHRKSKELPFPTPRGKHAVRKSWRPPTIGDDVIFDEFEYHPPEVEMSRGKEVKKTELRKIERPDIARKKPLQMPRCWKTAPSKKDREFTTT